jgi:hypothetical protein
MGHAPRQTRGGAVCGSERWCESASGPWIRGGSIAIQREVRLGSRGRGLSLERTTTNLLIGCTAPYVHTYIPQRTIPSIHYPGLEDKAVLYYLAGKRGGCQKAERRSPWYISIPLYVQYIGTYCMYVCLVYL